MNILIDLLVAHPLLLLFLVATLGYYIGEIRIKGAGLGIAAVLFVGLAIGALDARLTLPPEMISLGLVLFIYSVGLASGPGFFASFSRSGLRDNLMVAGVLLVAALIVAIEAALLNLKSTVAAGVYTGALTNTPALAQVLSYVANSPLHLAGKAVGTEPVVGYSVAYPMGVIGPILIILLMQRVWRIDYKRDAQAVRDMFPVEQEIYNRTVRITNADIVGVPIRDLSKARRWRVVFGRLQRGAVIELATGDTVLQPGDLISVIGTPEDVDPVVKELGVLAAEQLDLDRSAYDFRRVFVSNPDLVGRRLADLDLPHRFGAIVTRVRRGDIELLAFGDLVLELGDRVRFVAPRGQVRPLSEYFGDSYKRLSEINFGALGLGISLGLLLGMIPISLPGGIEFKLGEAGGPLIVALVLSALRRTGPVVWSIPYSANLTMRQLGLTILLAGIGIRSGYTFLTTLSQEGGMTILLAGAVISLLTPLLVLWIGYRLFKLPFGVLTGIVSAVHTQPAVQASALTQARNDLPNHGYALAFPMATIAKILLAQIIVAFLPYIR
ncbi:MAG TPA: transporter [Chloroflexi bacterium]|nr:transporter [Chloroflexota bacterium]HHW88801.1 transporter [Chloroflexota bacterium]